MTFYGLRYQMMKLIDAARHFKPFVKAMRERDRQTGIPAGSERLALLPETYSPTSKVPAL